MIDLTNEYKKGIKANEISIKVIIEKLLPAKIIEILILNCRYLSVDSILNKIQ